MVTHSCPVWWSHVHRPAAICPLCARLGVQLISEMVFTHHVVRMLQEPGVADQRSVDRNGVRVMVVVVVVRRGVSAT